MRYTDRSRIELDYACPRARYWQYEWHGIGLAPLAPNKDLAFGLAIAEQLARLKQGQAWTVAAVDPGDPQRLATALLTGYQTIVWPRWQEHFTLVAVEREAPRELAPDLIYNSRPDTVMQRKSDGTFWYGPEDKTTSYIDSLLTYAGNVQVHATGLCVEGWPELKGERVAGGLVQGLYKGFEKADTSGRKQFYHPLVNAYFKEGRHGITPDQWSLTWLRGWERTGVEGYPGGVQGWITDKMTPEELAKVFPTSEPVTIRRTLVEEYFRQVVNRERQIALWHREGRDETDDGLRVTFPQAFSQCDNFRGYRKPCPNKDLCFNPTTRRFPLTLYKKREPHHPNEAEQIVQEGRTSC